MWGFYYKEKTRICTSGELFKKKHESYLDGFSCYNDNIVILNSKGLRYVISISKFSAWGIRRSTPNWLRGRCSHVEQTHVMIILNVGDLKLTEDLQEAGMF